MKTLLTVVIAFAVAIVLMVSFRDYMPGAALILGVVAVIAAMITRSIRADPERGWPTLMVFSLAGMGLTGFFTMVGAAGAARFGWLMPVGALLFFGLAIFSLIKIPRGGRSTASRGSGGRRYDAVFEAAEQARAAEAERRRREARGKAIKAQNEVLGADQKIRELEATNAALRQEIATLRNDLDAAVNDPCFDQATHPLYRHV